VRILAFGSLHNDRTTREDLYRPALQPGFRLVTPLLLEYVGARLASAKERWMSAGGPHSAPEKPKTGNPAKYRAFE
jgi:hypothetical protein